MKNKKNLLILGSSSGIGLNIAKFYYKKRNFYNLILVSKDKKKISIYKKLFKGIDPIFFDLRNFEKYEFLFNKIIKKYGKVDYCVHSAGIHKINSIKSLSVKDLSETVDINLKSPIYLSKFIANLQYFSRPSSVLFISSVMGIVGEPGQVLYSSTKSGLYGLVKSLSVELAKYKIRINCVSPGIIDSPLYKKYSSQIVNTTNDKYISKHPLGIGSFSDLNNLIQFLLSDKSRWITGQNCIIDGGYSVN